MARHYIGGNKGTGLAPAGLTTGTSELSVDVQISILDGASLSKVDVALLIEAIEAYVDTNNVPA